MSGILLCPICRKPACRYNCGRLIYVCAECPVCYAYEQPLVSLPCGHVLCKKDFASLGGQLPRSSLRDHDGSRMSHGYLHVGFTTAKADDIQQMLREIGVETECPISGLNNTDSRLARYLWVSRNQARGVKMRWGITADPRPNHPTDFGTRLFLQGKQDYLADAASLLEQAVRATGAETPTSNPVLDQQQVANRWAQSRSQQDRPLRAVAHSGERWLPRHLHIQPFAEIQEQQHPNHGLIVHCPDANRLDRSDDVTDPWRPWRAWNSRRLAQGTRPADVTT